MSPTLLLIVYCLAIAGFSLLGGLLPSMIRMTHTRTQVVMSLVSGLMLGVAFYHLLPHSAALASESGGVDTTVWWLMIGLIVMLLLLRVFHFHQHDFSEEAGAQHEQATDHHHTPAHDHNHSHSHDQPVHGLSWVGLALGLAVHTLIDGVALGAVMHAGSHASGVLGIGVFLAIFLHKPLDAMSIVTVMQAGGWSKGARATTNLVFALMCPLGAMLFFFGVDVVAAGRDHLVAVALAFSAGAFICIALSDLLPEVHFHSHDRGKLTLAFLLGIALAYAIGSVEPAGIHMAPH
ncbi:Zinc transporter ZupT [Halioglobus japonicus]|nr:Zinc transporter ZupT [Halioglobus japonicus]